MEDILWDMIRADFLAREIIKQDSTKNLNTETNILSGKILAIHQIDKVKFDKSIQFYAKHPDIMKIVFDNLDTKKTMKNFSEKKKIKELQKNVVPRIFYWP
jgi:Domain of unknown function (DUF4296)